MRKLRKSLIVLFATFSLFACGKSSEIEEVNIVLQTASSQLSTYSILNNDMNPYSIEMEIEEVIGSKPKVVYQEPTEDKGGYGWLLEKISEGSYEKTQMTYEVVYDQFGNRLSKTYVPESMKEIASSPIVWEYGSEVKTGSMFFPKMTRYGSDCRGCNPDESGYSGTASGVAVGTGSVRQSDGTWRDGLTYDGYYIVASSKSLPMCTVLEITNHKYSGAGIEYGVPFKAIVLDRGVGDGALDLFAGSESSLNTISVGRNSKPRATILEFGKWTKNSSGQKMCRTK